MLTNQLLSLGFTREQTSSLSVNFSFEKSQLLQYLLEPILDQQSHQPMLDNTGNPLTSLSVLIQAGFTPGQLTSILNYENEVANIDILLDLLLPYLDERQQPLRDHAGNLITPLSNLISARFSHDQIVSVLTHYRGSKSLKALQELLQPMWDASSSCTIPFLVLIQTGFTPSGIISILNDDNGYRNLRALLRLYNPEPNPTGHATPLSCLVEAGFTLDQIISVLSHEGGYKKLQALKQLICPILGMYEQPSSPATMFLTTPLTCLLQAGFTISQLIFIVNRNTDLVSLLNTPVIFDFVKSQSRIVAVFELAKVPDRAVHTGLLKSILNFPRFRDYLDQQSDTVFQNLCMQIKLLSSGQVRQTKISSDDDLNRLCQQFGSNQGRLRTSIGEGVCTTNDRHRFFPSNNLPPTVTAQFQPNVTPPASHLDKKSFTV